MSSSELLKASKGHFESARRHLLLWLSDNQPHNVWTDIWTDGSTEGEAARLKIRMVANPKTTPDREGTFRVLRTLYDILDLAVITSVDVSYQLDADNGDDKIAMTVGYRAKTAAITELEEFEARMEHTAKGLTCITCMEAITVGQNYINTLHGAYHGAPKRCVEGRSNERDNHV